MNTHVNFELAKLLKEKGFFVIDRSKYAIYTNHNNEPKLEQYKESRHNIYERYGFYAHFYTAPAIAEVVMWLYEKHGIWIYVYWLSPAFTYDIVKVSTSEILTPKNEHWYHNSPTEAYSAAIKYCLTNLIK